MKQKRPVKGKTNISSSFLNRARCPRCFNTPNLGAISTIFNTSRYSKIDYVIEYKRSLASSDFYKSDYYIKFSFSPKDMKGNWISYVLFLGVKPGAYSAIKGLKDPNHINSVHCGCGATKWVYNMMCKRPEVINRKARY